MSVKGNVWTVHTYIYIPLDKKEKIIEYMEKHNIISYAELVRRGIDCLLEQEKSKEDEQHDSYRMPTTW